MCVCVCVLAHRINIIWLVRGYLVMCARGSHIRGKKTVYVHLAVIDFFLCSAGASTGCLFFCDFCGVIRFFFFSCFKRILLSPNKPHPVRVRQLRRQLILAIHYPTICCASMVVYCIRFDLCASLCIDVRKFCFVCCCKGEEWEGGDPRPKYSREREITRCNMDKCPYFS